MASPRSTEQLLPRFERLGAGGRLPTSNVDCDAVRDQLERILASAVFRNSKRYSSLLKYVVECALEGKAEHLKERAIGIDVFGRAADYDTNADHVVRSVAGEVRRRLAQYYMEPGREAELRIDLQAGSYVPHFQLPGQRLNANAVVAPAELRALLPLERAPLVPARNRLRWRFLLATGVVLGTVALAAMFAVRLAGPRTAFERFWSPVFSSANPILLCVGGGNSNAPPEGAGTLTVRDFERQPSRRMHTSDALALVGLAGLLQSIGKPYHILNRAGATSFKDLQSGPFVLIGGMNNEWTLRLTSALRFGFERQPSGARVVDRQNPSNTVWSFDFTTPFAEFNRDYAIVSRVRDPESEQTAVIVAGIGSWGTLAASEFVTNAEHLKKLEAVAPQHWERKNLQVVISTDVIRGSSGPPNVLAAHFW